MKTNTKKAPPYPVRRGGWPHPTHSVLSAHDFLQKSRPDDEVCAYLIGAFRPLPRRSLTRKEMGLAFGNMVLASLTVQEILKTEARFRTNFLPGAVRSIREVMEWIAREMEAGQDRRVAKRRKLDTREPRLSAAVSVIMAARKLSVPAPSNAELAALAVFHGGGEAGQPPTDDDGGRKVYWRTMRRRAGKLAAELEPIIGDYHSAFLDGVREEAIRWALQGDEIRAEIHQLERESARILAETSKPTGGTTGGGNRRRSVPRVPWPLKPKAR